MKCCFVEMKSLTMKRLKSSFAICFVLNLSSLSISKYLSRYILTHIQSYYTNLINCVIGLQSHWRTNLFTNVSYSKGGLSFSCKNAKKYLLTYCLYGLSLNHKWDLCYLNPFLCDMCLLKYNVLHWTCFIKSESIYLSWYFKEFIVIFKCILGIL